ncbi:hypothetical protein T492DRAFT_464064 [Pavlovales sp. CCMP2436]|nr:hypothetical protein T492DRAFT_464064 [Pavlovales sp. CCMP2436]
MCRHGYLARIIYLILLLCFLCRAPRGEAIATGQLILSCGELAANVQSETLHQKTDALDYSSEQRLHAPHAPPQSSPHLGTLYTPACPRRRTAGRPLAAARSCAACFTFHCRPRLHARAGGRRRHGHLVNWSTLKLGEAA